MTASSPVAASPELFTREDNDGVTTLTLNTPRNLNALSLVMLEALIGEFEAIASDDRARVIVLAGVGPAISAGHDLKEMQALATTIAQQSGPTLAIGKRAFYAQIEQPLDQAYSVASVAMINNLAEPDCVEGMSAFLEKRRPTWGIDTGE